MSTTGGELNGTLVHRSEGLPAEIGINTASFGQLPPDDTVASAHIPLYLPMSRGEFVASEWALLDPVDRVRYMRMKARLVRSRDEDPDASAYFDNIETAYELSFETVTPELIADSSAMKLIRCVDPYASRQLDQMNMPEESQISLPGGLGWLEVMGLIPDWAAARVFEPELAVGIHKNCGGFAILGALTAERQSMFREASLTHAQRALNETAVAVRNAYLRRPGVRIDAEAKEMLANFNGPVLTIGHGDVGTAQVFVTPKITAASGSLDAMYTPRELVGKVEGWLERRASETLSE